MPHTKHPIRDDLRGLYHGELAFDVPTRSLYATDASPFEVMPMGVATPRDEADLVTLITYAAENQIPLMARGAGTGLAGESLGSGLIVDLSVHFRKIVSIESDHVRVQAGVTLNELNAALSVHGRRLAVDTESRASCTIGGMIATNASGGNAFQHGTMRDHVLALRTIWDNGEACWLNVVDQPTTVPQTSTLRTTEIRSLTTAMLIAHRDAIQLTRPMTTYNRCGYILHDVLTPNGVDLARLLVGSEGTLAIIPEAVLRTEPIAGGTCQAMLGFTSTDDAVQAGLMLRLSDGIVACDLLDQRVLAITTSHRTEANGIVVPPETVAVLLVIWESETEDAATRFGGLALEALAENGPLVMLVPPSCETDQHQRIRQFRQVGVSGLYGIGSGPRPIACVEDIGVPVDELPRFLAEARKVLRRFDLTGSMLVHVLTGQVHTRPFVDLNDADDRAILWPCTDALHMLAIALGGTISTQHGTGIARTPWVEKQYGHLMPVFRELKSIFDPRGILNPGKIVGIDPSRPAWPFRQPQAEQRTPLLVWSDSTVSAEASKCNGCGDCRTHLAPQRMCPIFHSTSEESATPRAKANLMRHLHGDPAVVLTDTETRTIAGECVNCKMCRTECPAQVNIPKLMLEAKSAYHAEHGLDRGDWTLARTESVAKWASYLPFTTNRMLGNRVMRWLFEKFFNLSRQRVLPRFSRRGFMRRARKQGLTQHCHHDVKVAYFVDGFANYNDPSIGEATVAVLRHHGIGVHVPRRQRSSGMAALAQGDVETARKIAAYNVRTLAELVREGYTIVCSEPTAALALTQDYLDLLDDPDAKLVAANTVELTAFLYGLHLKGELKTDFVPIEVTLGHHVPCHIKALPGPIAGPELLRLIPGLTVETIDVSCSGMAGSFGLTKTNYETSMRAGQAMFEHLRRPNILFGATECASCRMQMHEGARQANAAPDSVSGPWRMA